MTDYKPALKHFKNVDPIMAQLVIAAASHAQPPVLRAPVKPDQYFYELAESIVSQQLSVKAASTIWNRLVALTGGVSPENILKKSHEELRRVGLSNAKANYIRGLSEMLINDELDLADLHKLDDEVVIERLVAVKGIGRWSAEMFLMFTLARPDVFSTGDLGLIRAVEQAYGRNGITVAELEALASNWSPYRTYAALVLWHNRDNSPKV